MNGSREVQSSLQLNHSEDEEIPVDELQASIEQRIRSGAIQVPILNDDDDDLIESEEADSPLTIVKSENSALDEERAERELATDIATVIDLTEDELLPAASHQDSLQQRSSLPSRNSPIDEGNILSKFEYGNDNLLLRAGVVVELNEIAHIFRASFLRIQYIIRSHSNHIILRGLPFTRSRHLRGQLPRLRNEVCLVLKIDADDNRPDEEQAAIEVPVAEVKRIRNLHCTNATFPGNRFPPIYESAEEAEEKGMLACRWKYVLIYKDADARNNKQLPFQFIIEHLRADKASTEHNRVSDLTRLNNWRGSKVRGGSYDKTTGKDLEPVEDIDEDFSAEPSWIPKSPGQRYSMGDMFSGAGGASLGAQKAGFHIRVACDKSPHACKTHRHNFPHTDLREEDIYKFMREDLIWGCKTGYVDILHLSPPCQFWSPAHTVPSANDDANIAVLFSCHELIKKLKPRIFTLEQTFGIMHPRFEHYFNALIHGFTQHSYSVRWKVVNLLDWGLSSRRNRLIMLGACPGERLPPFPPATHARDPPPGSALRPHATALQALRRIPRDASLHGKRHRWWRRPWDPRAPLARCITTHGGYGNYHYSGRRDFTLRELATLMGFPVRFEFHRTNAKRQIGNAFPPCVVRLLYGHLLCWLEKEDRVYPVEEQAVLEEEPEYDVEVTDVEDEVEFIREQVTRKGSDEGAGDEMDVDFDIFCIDSNQEARQGRRGTVIDLTADSPPPAGNQSPIVIMDID